VGVMQIASGPEILAVEAGFPAANPHALFTYWTVPTLLQQWWPQHAEIEPYVGGAYHLTWPQQDWHLRGRYTTFEPGERLCFTWKWDHDAPTDSVREVTIAFTPGNSGGTGLFLTHGPYLDTLEEQELRLEHHLTGWMYFLPRLQALLEPAHE
jgi:uncharacterized protein YndB with AHSA1/START domain